MRTDRRWLRTGSMLLLTVALAACLEPLDPTSIEVERVIAEIGASGSEDTIQVRHTTRVRAAAYAREGYDIGLTEFRYASSDTTVARVDSIGTVIGVSPGSATITVSIPQGKSATVSVVVTPSTIAYVLPAGGPAGIAFSTDYTRAYVLTTPDSLVVFDALAMYRLGAIPLAFTSADVAATSSLVFITHPNDDSVTVVSKATNAVERRLWVGAGPTGAVGQGARAFIATRFDRQVVIVENGVLTLGIPMNGEPHELAISHNGRRLFASVDRGGAWHIVPADPQAPDTLPSVAVSSRPTAVSANTDGSRVYVLLAAESRLVVLEENALGRYEAVASVPVGSGAGGVSASPSNRYIVISGDPVTILDAATLAVLEEIPGVGTGHVSVRPDGIFVFIADPRNGLIKVVEL